MVSSWPKAKLGEIAEVIMGQSPKGSLCNENGTGLPLLNGPTEFTAKYPIPTQFTTDPRKFAEEGDLLFCVRGSTTGRMNWADQEYAIGRGIGAFRHKKGNEYQPFLRALIEFKLPLLLQSATGSTFPNVSRNQLLDLEINIPSDSEALFISKIIGELDKKIFSNQQTNQTFEQMAQALFKSWFVDFDPVIDNALSVGNLIPDELQKRTELRQRAIAERNTNPKLNQLSEDVQQLFPSEFEESELGWIPKGWEVSALADLINIKHGFAYKGEFFSDEKTEDILLTPGNVCVGGGFKSAKYKYYNGPIVEEYIFKEGDVYLNMTDLSKASDTLGYPAVVPEIEGITFHHNQRLGKVLYKGHNSAKKEFIYQVLCSHTSRNNVLASATGTTVKHTSPTKILSLLICHSGGRLEGIFENYAKAFYKKSALNDSSNIALTKLRDTLLPKLISGELQIPDVKAAYKIIT
jgi:type I restriction enzyme S subunit